MDSFIRMYRDCGTAPILQIRDEQAGGTSLRFNFGLTESIKLESFEDDRGPFPLIFDRGSAELSYGRARGIRILKQRITIHGKLNEGGRLTDESYSMASWRERTEKFSIRWWEEEMDRYRRDFLGGGHAVHEFIRIVIMMMLDKNICTHCHEEIHHECNPSDPVFNDTIQWDKSKWTYGA